MLLVTKKKFYTLIRFTQWKSTLVNREVSTVKALYYSGILIYDSVYVHYVSTRELFLSSL